MEDYDITKPFPNEHACRLKPPNYPRYARQNCKARHEDKCIDFIYGIRGPQESELQSMRYPKKIWDAGAAKSHCKSKKGTFEAASGRSTMEIYLKSEGQYVKKEMSQGDFLNWFKSNTDDEGNVQEDCMLYKNGDIDINTDKSITFRMSDDTLDRDFERFDTSGWDLKNYKKNPVVLWGHNRNIPAIGIMDRPRVKDNDLIGSPVFDEDDDFAMKISKKVDKRIIRTGSVSFFPTKIEVIDDEKDPCKLIYKKQELREFSICNVPANPNSVIIEDGKSHLQETQPDKYIPSDSTRTLQWDRPASMIENAVITVEMWEQKCDEIKDMKIDIENLKEMQMKMADTVIKDDRNYYEDLMKVKKLQPKGLEKLYPIKSS